MLNRLLKGLVDLVYGTGRVKRKYELEHPLEKVLASDASKGIQTIENQDITRGIDWIASQRAVILLTSQKIVCGQWVIPLEHISNAQLLKINTLLSAGQVLKIQTTHGDNYQFGMQINPEWTKQQILPLTLEKGQIKYSAFSIIVRVFLIGYLFYKLYVNFIAN